jgi:hypothetical protein
LTRKAPVLLWHIDVLTVVEVRKAKEHNMQTNDPDRNRSQTWAEIAVLYQVTARTVLNWRKAKGLDDLRGRLCPKDVARIFEELGAPYTGSDYRWPQTWGEIAALYRYTDRTIYTWRKARGLEDISGRLRPGDVVRIFDALGNPYSEPDRKWPQTWAEIADLYRVTSQVFYNMQKMKGLSNMHEPLRPMQLIHIFDALGNPYPPPQNVRRRNWRGGAK